LLSASPGLPLTKQLGRRQGSGGGKGKEITTLVLDKCNVLLFVSRHTIIDSTCVRTGEVGSVRYNRRNRLGEDTPRPNGVNSTANYYGGFMYTGLFYNVSRRRGRNGLVAGGAERVAVVVTLGARRVYLLTEAEWSRVNTSTAAESESTPRRSESQVNTSTGAESESAPRRAGSRVNTSTGTESESTPRKAEVESTPLPERSPSQHFGRRKSSQHLDRKAQDFESAPRNVGRMVLLSSQLLEYSGKEWSRLSKLAGLYTSERPKIRPGSVCGARMFARCGMCRNRDYSWYSQRHSEHNGKLCKVCSRKK